MLYVLAILLPPVAVFMAGTPGQGILNIILCFLFWIPGTIHALFVVKGYYDRGGVKP